MAHFALLWKARTIEKYRLNYEKEKTHSIVMANAEIPQKSLFQRCKHYRYDTQKRLSRTFRNWYPEGSKMSNFLLYLKTDQTFPNFLLKSFLGFFSGIVLTYLWFIFFVFQLSISLIHATIMSSIIGVLLTLGLAFSYRIRCLVFLLIPQFFSRVGRYTLTCYALVLILTGPATNTLKNSEVLSESMACSQEQIKTSVREINELMKKPFNTMKDSIKLMMDRMKEIAVKITKILLRINRLVLSIASVIQKGFSWLQSVAIFCNHKLGKPYEYCINAMNDRAKDCKEIFGDNFPSVCKVTYATQATCAAVKSLKYFCSVADFVDDSFIATVKKKLKNFSERVRTMLYVEVHIHHSYSFSSNISRSPSQVAAGIVTEIRKRADPLITWLSWSSCVTSLFLLLIIFRAKYYQHMFETRCRFDNRYVTKELRELDLKRLRQGRETVLPLNRRERTKYITTTSFRLVSSEKVFINRSMVFMSITSFKLLIHMVADYSLYWVLMTIRYHGRFQSPTKPATPDTGLHISGSGFIAQLLQSIVGVLNIPLAPPIQSPISCLPDPYPPDFRRYAQIGVLIFLLWFFALFEPYGLRLRHVIMGHYRPERAKARAVWLYNHILRTRGGFMKYARRKLHREYKYTTEATFTFKRWLHAHIPFQWLRSLLGMNPEEPHCLLCGTTDYANDPDTQLIRCETPNCPGTYCLSCFSDIGELCTICLSPSDYGDLSDASFEKGSSDESDDSESDVDDNRERNIPQNKDWQQAHESNEYDCSPKETKTEKNNLRPSVRKITTQDKIPLLPYCSKPIAKCQNILNKAVTRSEPSQIYFKKTHRIKSKDTILTCLLKSLPMLMINNGKNGIVIGIKIGHIKEEILKRSNHENSLVKYNLNDVLQKLRRYSMLMVHKNGSERTPKNIFWSKKRNARNIPNNRQKIFNNSLSFYFYIISYSKKSIRVTKNLHSTRFTKQIRRKYKKIIRSKKKFREKETNKTLYNNCITINSQYSIPVLGDCTYRCHENNNKKEPNVPDTVSPCDNNNKKAKPNNYKSELTNNESKEKIYLTENNTSSDHLGKFHMFFSRHWNTLKFILIPCSELLKSNRNLPPQKERKHRCKKKRKKLNKLENKSPKNYKSKKNINDTRNYRISAYLADQDWIKKKFVNGGSFLFETKVESKHSPKKASSALSYENESTKTIKQDFAADLIKPPTLKWNKSSSQESIADNLFNPKIPVDQEVNCIPGKNKDLPKRALDQLFKRVSKSSGSKSSLSTPSGAEKNDVLHDSALKDVCNTELSKSERRIKYFFRSIGKNDLEEEIKNSKSGNTDNDYGSGEDSAKGKILKSIVKKKLSVRNQCDDGIDENLSRDHKLAAHSSSVHFEENLEGIDENDSQQDYNNDCTHTRKISDRLLDFGLRRPLSIMKDLYSSLFLSEEEEINVGNKDVPSDIKEEPSEIRCSETHKIVTVDKEVTALPSTQSCACQYFISIPESQDRTTQIRMIEMPDDWKYNKIVIDAQANATTPVCTCGTQYHPQNKIDTGTVCCKKLNELSDSTENSDSSFRSLGNNTYSISDDSITDTTICSLATMSYRDESMMRKRRRLKVNVITKANQSTLTDRMKVCDVSTTTNDWWSPIVERKNKVNDKDISLEKKIGEYLIPSEKLERKRAKNKGVTNDGRVVAFRSRAQIIPTATDNILSPSRYLLESQKYYNELFSSRFYAPHVFPVTQYQKHQEDKVRSSVGSGHHSRRGHKTKRLEDSYSPRKPTKYRSKTVESAEVPQRESPRRVL